MNAKVNREPAQVQFGDVPIGYCFFDYLSGEFWLKITTNKGLVLNGEDSLTDIFPLTDIVVARM